mmetsp:Transcript_54491/g.157568  ORF Transcript_54491/g.157568 Transcript_54491/m.157568 type:complete len:249 (-) Transcript_54491:1137-1883(-)
MTRAMCRCSSLNSFSFTDMVRSNFWQVCFSSSGRDSSSSSSKMPSIIAFRSVTNFATFFWLVRVSLNSSSPFSSSSDLSASASSSSALSSPASAISSSLSPSFASVSPSGFTASSSVGSLGCSVSSSLAGSFSGSSFFFQRPRPRPFFFFLIPVTSASRSSSFWSINVGVTKSGITFCQNKGSSISKSALLESLVNFDLLTTIPCLFSQDAVFAPSTTRVRVLLARMLSMSSAQNAFVISSFSSSMRA